MTSPNTELRSLTKHEKYYLTGGDLNFLVENVHFRVHRYFFERESGYFISKLSTPASPGQKAQGTQDSNAILLEDLKTEEFATFLWVFYNPQYSLYDTTVSEWEVILRLSVRWDFPEVKNLAVRELEKKEIPDAKRIKLYHENKVDRNVLIPRYAALCEREAHLTLEEGQDIGLETVLMIAAGRQEARASRLATGGRSPLSPTITGTDLHNVVREIFKIVPEPSNNTGGLSITPQPTTIPTPTQRPTAPTAPAPTPTPMVKTRILKTQNETSRTIMPMVTTKKTTNDGEAGVDAKAEGNKATQGVGDLLGLSFTDFGQTPSTTVPPSSAFKPFSFGSVW